MIMFGNQALDKIESHAKRAARFAGWLAIPAFFAAMLGIGGVGYCDQKARFSPQLPDTVHGYTEAVNFKGTTRYVSPLNAKICGASFPIAFSGMGIFILMVGSYYWAFHRLPGK